jgi:hypothetical protein
LQRNRLLFLAKWREIAQQNGLNLPESRWQEFGKDYAVRLLQDSNHKMAETVLQSLAINYPDDPEVIALEIACAFKRGDMQRVSELGKRLNRLAPGFDLQNLFDSMAAF